MKKQVTAVEWLQDELEELFISTPYINWNKIFEKAKQKEKQYIIDANIAGMEFIPVDPNKYDEDAEKYYNEKFKSE